MEQNQMPPAPEMVLVLKELVLRQPKSVADSPQRAEVVGRLR